MDCEMSRHKGESETGRGNEEKRFKEFFSGWFNNRMAIILMAIQHLKRKDAQAILRIEFFLEDVEHHFTDSHAPKWVRNAFRYLKSYFKVYPEVTLWQSYRAVEMIARIYESLGLKLQGQRGFIPHTLLVKGSERTQCASCSTIL